MSKQLLVPRYVLDRASKHVAKAEYGAFKENVYITHESNEERPKSVCWATNGHQLMRWTFDDGNLAEDFPIVEALPNGGSLPATIVLSGETAAKLAKAIPTKGSVKTLPILGNALLSADENGDLWAGVTDLDASQVIRMPATDDTELPKGFIQVWDSANKDREVTCGFSAQYLKLICESAIASAKANGQDTTKAVPLTFYADGEKSACRIEHGDGNAFLLMPVVVS